MTDDCIPSNKNLNELLPSNLLSEMDYIEEEEKTDESESWDEGIDDLSYKINPTKKQIEYCKKQQQEQNLFSYENNVNIFNNLNQNNILQNQQNQFFQNQNNFLFFPQSQPTIYQNINFIQNCPNNILNIINFPYTNIPHERKRTENTKHQNRKFTELNINNKKKTSFNTTIRRRNNYDQIDQYEIKEFENYLNNLPFSLIDYLRTQKGAKEVQKNILKSPQECKTILINKLNSNLNLLMTDIYGNYFCQDIIKGSNQNQIVLILKYISEEYVNIAKNYSGTHVLQTICDMITSQEEENLILNSIEGKELEMAYDSNATHVLQKIITTINECRRQNLNNIIIENLKNLSLDVNGICLVKKFIANNILNPIKNKIIQIISKNCIEISQSPFGNYAVQYILEFWGINQCCSIVNIIISNICILATQKFSSNVSEKIIEYLDEKNLYLLIHELFYTNKVMSILKNKYGRYVLQKAVKALNKNQRDELSFYLSNLNITNNKDRNKLKNFITGFEIKLK